MEVPNLNVYITHWVKPTRQTPGRKLFTEFSEIGEHLVERIRGVGVPRLSHPIMHVLWNLSTLGLPRTVINIFCNAEPELDLRLFHERARFYGTELDFNLIVSEPPILSDPFSLTTLYKSKFSEDVSQASENDLFLYLEHDQIFDRINLNYFLEWTSKLSKFGLRPGFLRVEWHSLRKDWVSTDQNKSTQINSVPNIEIDGITFVDLSSSYSGMFLVDLEHANMIHLDRQKAVHENSHNQINRSDVQDYVSSLGTAEKSAIGSRFLHHNLSNSPISNWFSSYAVGFDALSLRPHPGACIWHASNNYAKRRVFRKDKYGSLLLDEICFR